MKKAILYFLFALSVSMPMLGQRDSSAVRRHDDKPKWNWRDRLYWGGNVGAWFGSLTFVDISPLIGVRLNEKFSVGVGAIYNYYSYNYYGTKYSTNLYGSRIYGRYFILENVFLQAGWDHINRDNPYSYNLKERVWVENLLVGGGLRYPISNRMYMTAMGLWNINQGPLSPYANPIIQVGFIGRF